ncbi:MAG TPA: putative baseplate assembly protein [Pyrinomonadaceae bacterium]|jgi:hypothetical protein
MPLPQPNLDDKNFVVLVEEATRLIPRHAPEWTDHNRHDPGITLVELFAWLAEMQQYHLNRVGDESRRKFLKLLGIRPRDAASARTEITFRTTNGRGHVVPRGTKLATADKLIFETEEMLSVLPVALKKVFSFTGTRMHDHTDLNALDGLSFDAFGEEAAAGSSLYLGFDAPFPADQIISLNVRLDDAYPVERGTHGDEQPSVVPSARVVWEYLNASGDWSPLELMAEFEAAFERQLRGGVESASRCFEARPRVLEIIRSSPSFHALTKEAREFVERMIQEAASVEQLQRTLYDTPFLLQKKDETLMLSQSGRLFFPSPRAMGVRAIYPSKEQLHWLRATVRKSGYELPPRIDTVNINTIPAVQRDTISEVAHFSSDGQPAQRFHASSFLALKGQNFVQVRERDGLWKDWTRINSNDDSDERSFQQSGPNDLHYIIRADEATKRITLAFGDGEHGKIPPAGDGGVRLISYLPAFEEQRLVGRSNGLPGQRFMLDHTPVVAGSFMLQVEERIELPSSFTEEADVACLLRFRRTVPARVRAGETFEVGIVLEAQQELCDISITEHLRGELDFQPNEASRASFRFTDDREARLVVERIHAGEVKTLSYLVKAGERGGSIHGQTLISTAHQCPTVLEASPVSVVEIGRGHASAGWRDFVRVDDFDASGPDDAHYVLDATAGEIIFGDGISGSVPQPLADEDGKNIRVISYQTGGGTTGNVAAGSLTKFAEIYSVVPDEAQASLAVTNEGAATGGSAPEELEEAEARTRRDLKTCYQAITTADYEYLARSTPGLRVARARALPLYAPGLENYPESQSPASVTVVVVPYSTALKPVPSPEFLRTVCRHLNQHRLVTTQVYAVAPDYVRVGVRATAVLRAGFDPVRTSELIEKQLDNFLRPLPVEDDHAATHEGWPFGRAVYKSEIYQLVEQVEGVDCVERVVLVADGAGVARSAQGNIHIPPQSLVYPGEHAIEIISPTPECRSTR